MTDLSVAAWRRMVFHMLVYVESIRRNLAVLAIQGRAAPKKNPNQELTQHQKACAHPPGAAQRRGNQYASWTVCRLCSLRTSYEKKPAAKEKPTNQGKDKKEKVVVSCGASSKASAHPRMSGGQVEKTQESGGQVVAGVEKTQESGGQVVAGEDADLHHVMVEISGMMQSAFREMGVTITAVMQPMAEAFRSMAQSQQLTFEVLRQGQQAMQEHHSKVMSVAGPGGHSDPVLHGNASGDLPRRRPRGGGGRDDGGHYGPGADAHGGLGLGPLQDESWHAEFGKTESWRCNGPLAGHGSLQRAGR